MRELKRTPIYPEYEKLGARTIDFGGWDMPVQLRGLSMNTMSQERKQDYLMSLIWERLL